MVTINNLTFHFGGRVLYHEASLQIKPGDRIGLIGANGTGKSTLLRLINGEYTPDEGEITTNKGFTLGFLNQDQLSFGSEESILEIALKGFEKENQIHQEMEKLIARLDEEYREKDMERLAELQEQYEKAGGYTLRSRAEEILEGLGFNTEDLQRSFNEFSGGWRMRVLLGQLLLKRPSLLMLDEPTNHLDLPSIQWLENYLQHYEGAVILVSHDRKFLNNLTNTIVEIDDEQLTRYEGNLDKYVQQKEEMQENQQKAYENQQKRIKQLERFIERFRAQANKASQVQSKIKQLEKMEKVDPVENKGKTINIRFTPTSHSGRVVAELNNISKSFGDLEIFRNTSAVIERKDKIALISANGMGKSTLMRILAGTESYKGEFKKGYNVVDSHYAQHQSDALNEDNTVFEELNKAAPQKSDQEIRNLLGSFLFSNEDVNKKIHILSGGEKARVALAKTLLDEANFILLDEPTNHLDMESTQQLADALKNYEGSYIVISHDRDFIKNTANKIWYIEDKQIKEFPGSFDEFITWYQEKRNAGQAQNTGSTPSSSGEKKKEQKQGQPDEAKKYRKEQKQIQQKLEKIEENISSLEEEKKQLEEELSKPSVYSDIHTLQETNDKFREVTEKIKQEEEEWEEYMKTKEQLDNKLNTLQN